MANPNLHQPRTIRNPEKWIGKRTPKGWNDSAMQLDYFTCDHCGRWYNWDDLHNLLYPVSSYDTWLQRQLHIEEAEGYCPDCLTRLECEAEKVDPEWLAHHYRGMDESDGKAPTIVDRNPYAVEIKPAVSASKGGAFWAWIPLKYSNSITAQTRAMLAEDQAVSRV